MDINCYYTVEEIVELNPYNLNWNMIDRTRGLSEEFIRKYESELYWEHLIFSQKLSNSQKLSKKFIIEFRNKVYIDKIKSNSANIEISKNLDDNSNNDPLILYIPKYDNVIKDKNHVLSLNNNDNHDSDIKYNNDINIEYNKITNLYQSSRYQKLSEEFQDNVDWENISIYQRLSEDSIREFQDKVDWDYISMYQKLSEDFIHEFQDNVNWDIISRYQILSEDFIKEFNYIDNTYYIVSKKERKRIINDMMNMC
ncbi:hypothetical protein FPHOBKDP_00055 [Listeria phage LPJP1]|nr:hypothetical protein FPHOBKDP_00055 [Listeria phage LPJP1]